MTNPIAPIHKFSTVGTLADIARYQAGLNPDAVALSFEGRETTYRGLDAASSRVANGLIPGCLTREAATENLSASLLNHLMNTDQASGPRMPRIKKLVLRDPVGVPSSCCKIASERTDHWIRMRRFLARFSEPV
jgi:hypothetical protein